MKYILLILILLLLPIVHASTHTEIREKGQELGTIENIDDYLQETNIYQFLYYRKGLNRYWEDRIGDCTEIARTKYIMYRSIGIKSKIVHGCVMRQKESQRRATCSKHDYVEYYLNNSWQSNEQELFRDILIKKGRGIW